MIATANVVVLAILPLSWMRPLIALPFAGRVIAAVILIGPASFCLGFFFPLGIRAVARREPALVAWAFGINGATSVPAVVAASLFRWPEGAMCILPGSDEA